MNWWPSQLPKQPNQKLNLHNTPDSIIWYVMLNYGPEDMGHVLVGEGRRTINWPTLFSCHVLMQVSFSSQFPLLYVPLHRAFYFRKGEPSREKSERVEPIRGLSADLSQSHFFFFFEDFLFNDW